MDNLPDKESKSKGSDQEALVLWMTRTIREQKE